MKFNLQKFLKTLKLNESEISMFLGALVVIVTGVLVVNYFKDKKGEIITNNNSKTEITSDHVVTKGETLWSIAEDSYGSGYNWVDIYSANKLTSQKLEVGQKLTIPEVSAKKPTATKVVSVLDKTSAISQNSYTIEKGDSLWKIAVRSYGDGYKWVEIAKANKLVNPNLLHVGNVLTLPR